MPILEPCYSVMIGYLLELSQKGKRLALLRREAILHLHRDERVMEDNHTGFGEVGKRVHIIVTVSLHLLRPSVTI